MALFRHDTPVFKYGNVETDEDWVYDNAATTMSALKDVSDDRTPGNDMKQPWRRRRPLRLATRRLLIQALTGPLDWARERLLQQ